MNFFSMEQCIDCMISSFLAGYTEPVPSTDLDFLKIKSLDPYASKQLEIISWFHTNDISMHSSDPKFTHLLDANTVF